jgi:predicted nucleic acid-binding protein
LVESTLFGELKQIVFATSASLRARRVHWAVMEQPGVDRILTFDSGFDGFPGIARLS